MTCCPRPLLCALLFATLTLFPVGVRSDTPGSKDAPAPATPHPIESWSGVEISGQITDEEGLPLHGALVTLKISGRKMETRSAADGTFVYRGVHSGLGSLIVDKEGYAASKSEKPVVVGVEPVSGLIFRLGRGATLSGQILGLEKDELSQLRVFAHNHGKSRNRYGRIDSEGRYVVSNLSARGWTVVARNRDTGQHIERRIVIDAGVSEVTLDLDFNEGFEVLGMVQRNGIPKSGHRVSLMCFESSTPQAQTRTREDGSFRLRGSGRCKLSIEDDESWLSRREDLEIEQDRELLISYDTASVSGRVKSSDSQPIAEAGVFLTMEGTGKAHYTLGIDDASDAQGSFRFENLPEGLWEMKVWKEGYEEVSIPLEVRSGQPIEDLLVEMNTSRRLSARVTLESGRVPEEVSLVFFDGSGQYIGFERHSLTDDGLLDLSLSHAEAAEVALGTAFGPPVTLTIPASGSLGYIRFEGTGGLMAVVPDLLGDRVPVTLTLTGPDGKHYEPALCEELTDPPKTISRFKGRINSSSCLKPGSWRITVATEDGRSWSSMATVIAERFVEVSLRSE